MVSRTTEYVLRALVEMAGLPPAATVLGRDLARKTKIPFNYLSKILNTLRNAGYLEATRGRGGGYRLAKPASRIKLIDIVELFEGVRTNPGCWLGVRDRCSDTNPCSAHSKWKEVRLAYIAFLESNTVADISQAPCNGRSEVVPLVVNGQKRGSASCQEDENHESVNVRTP
jgi:Rrf2 family transcriptional regulator, iron-sulfur cluster assembly transcription factor